MKKVLAFLTIFAFSFLAIGGVQPLANDTMLPAKYKKETYVYVCNSNTAYAYHSSKDCRGLRNCTHDVLKVSLADAVNIYKRKPCKICER